MDESRDALRLAIFVVWKKRCVWCRQPLAYHEMEVDHLIPKSLHGDELTEALRLHGLPNGYELDGTRNLVPACRLCNANKERRIPPNAPGLTLLVQAAEKAAPQVAAEAQKFREKRRLATALGVIQSAAAHLTDEQSEELMRARSVVELFREELTCGPDASYRVRRVDHTFRLGPRIEVVETIEFEAITELVAYGASVQWGRSMTPDDIEVEVLDGDGTLADVLLATDGILTFIFAFRKLVPPGGLAYLRFRQSFAAGILDVPCTAFAMEVPPDELVVRLQVLPGVAVARVWRRDGAPVTDAARGPFDIPVELSPTGFTSQSFTEMERGRYYGIAWEPET